MERSAIRRSATRRTRLLCSDLFTHVGEAPPITEDDIFDAAVETDALFPFTPATPPTAPTLRRLADPSPRTLAIMHGASYRGDARAVLGRLAALYEKRLKEAAAVRRYDGSLGRSDDAS